MSNVTIDDANELVAAIRAAQDKLREVAGTGWMVSIDDVRPADSEEVSTALNTARARGQVLRNMLGVLDSHIYWDRADPFRIVPRVTPQAEMTVEGIRVARAHMIAAMEILREMDTRAVSASGLKLVEAESEEASAAAGELESLRDAFRGLQSVWQARGFDAGFSMIKDK